MSKPEPDAKTLQEAIEAVLSSYSPRKIDPSVWAAFGPLVVAAVRQSQPKGPTVARRRLQAAARFVGWASAQGIEADASELLTTEHVERFCATSLPGGSTAATYRSELRALLGTQVKATPTPRQHRTPRKPPYGPADLSRFAAEALNASEPWRSRGLVIVALAAGAGFSSRDLRTLKYDDLSWVDGLWWATSRAPGYERTVAVRASLSYLLDETLKSAPTGDVFPAGKSAVSETTSRINPDAPMVVARLRTTWQVWALAQDVAFPVFVEASGLSVGDAVGDLLGWVGEPTDDQRRQLGASG